MRGHTFLTLHFNKEEEEGKQHRTCTLTNSILQSTNQPIQHDYYYVLYLNGEKRWSSIKMGPRKQIIKRNPHTNTHRTTQLSPHMCCVLVVVQKCTFRMFESNHFSLSTHSFSIRYAQCDLNVGQREHLSRRKKEIQKRYWILNRMNQTGILLDPFFLHRVGAAIRF